MFPSKGLGKLHYWNSYNYLLAFSVSNKPGFQDRILTKELRKPSIGTQSWGGDFFDSEFMSTLKGKAAKKT